MIQAIRLHLHMVQWESFHTPDGMPRMVCMCSSLPVNKLRSSRSSLPLDRHEGEGRGSSGLTCGLWQLPPPPFFCAFSFRCAEYSKYK